MKSAEDKREKQERLMEIVTLLLQRVVETPQANNFKEDLVKGLAEEGGYTGSEIEDALNLLLFASEKISHALVPRNDRPLHPEARVFVEAERLRLAPAVRDRLLRYRVLGLLKESEWEEIILHLLYYEDGIEAGESELNEALCKVIGDERLLLLLPHADARWALMAF